MSKHYGKRGQVSKKPKKHRSVQQERLASMNAPSSVGKVDGFDRRFTNDYSKSRPQITDQMEFDFDV